LMNWYACLAEAHAFIALVLMEGEVRPPSPLRGFAAIPAFACIPERRLVDGAGLEPAASALRTRRSPS
jgi:hypothetical protein